MHVLKRFSLSRRAMLRGIIGGSTVAVGLPLLEAMLDAHGEAHADGSALPRQIVTWLQANGFLLSRLEPEAVGASWELTPQLEPLADLKDYVNICTGYENHGQVDSFLFGHFEGITAYSGYPMEIDTQFYTYDAGGPTIDQVVADYYADTVGLPVRSLQTGVSKAMSLEGVGNLGSAFSFRGAPGQITPLPPQWSPREVWNTLFGFLPGPDAPADDRQLRSSILDVVKAQADRLRPRLGAADKARVDAHLQGVHELEQKISAIPPPCTLPEEPNEENLEPLGAEHITDVTLLMAQLIAYALHCDITRVASVQLLGVAGETPWHEAGLSATHHTISHDAQFYAQSVEDYHMGIVYQMERLADFARVFRETQDPLGNNLLDTSIILASSDASVGWMHSITRHPMILIGTGGGHLEYPGIHSRAAPNNPSDPDGSATPYMPTAGNTSDILLSILQAYDPSADRVGGGQAESTHPLNDIVA
jgi:hypothetical protein